jgi:hypothetical protein
LDVEPVGSFYRKPPARPEEVPEPPEEFAREPAADWVLDWCGALLPHGGCYQGRLAVREATATAAGQVEYPLSHSRPVGPRQLVLEPSDVTYLLDVLRQSFSDTLASVQAHGSDGIPFELVVYRREPYRGIRVRCNLWDEMWLLSGSPRPSPPPVPIFVSAGKHLAKLMGFRVQDQPADKPPAPIFLLGKVLFAKTLVASQAPA